MSGEPLSGEELQELFGENDAADASTKSLAETTNKQEGSHFISKFQSSMMLARFCVGSGLFSIPAAFRYSGIWVGIFWIFINGLLMAYGMNKLAKLSYEISRRTGASTVYYGDIGEECAKVIFKEKCGNFGRILINVVIALACFALVCTQMIYIAEIWKQGFEQLGIQEMDISSWILIVYCCLFPLFQIRRPDILATCSLLANILTLIGTITIFVYIFSANIFQTYRQNWRQEDEVQWTKLPLTIGITFYAYQLVAPLIVTMRNVMQEPNKIPFVINIVMACVTVLYGLLGATGYAACFPQCKDSILLNVPGSRYHSIVKILLGLASSVGSVLGMFVCFNVVEPILKTLLPENRFLVASITTRIFVVTFAAGITAAVPELGNVMSLAGTLTNPTLSLILPAIGHIALFYKTCSRISLAKDIALLFCGLLILVIGVYTSLYYIFYDLAYVVPNP
ncbi:proton-coupled amino acid transporter 1 isoform X2 [Paramuricea clavata]|uniref:Proton-coupled amino acid transporter 1 isoform X2 n=1 Tax=Paramuricea clavata TaxID=317549 RepID=A0A6S7FQQ7_PARCT|nr:proton-coupled amino acid transporter 1 isoform X2 [Paramuricea clavata]